MFTIICIFVIASIVGNMVKNELDWLDDRRAR